jgi:hypothetical protein
MARALPCTDDLWEATDAVTWRELYLPYKKDRGERPWSLNSTLGELSEGDSQMHLVGSMGRMALISAIYQTVFELRSRPANPLLDCGLEQFQKQYLHHWQPRIVELLNKTIPKIDGAPSTISGSFFPKINSQATVSTLIASYHVLLLTVTPVDDIFKYTNPKASVEEHERAKASLTSWVSQQDGQTGRRAVLYACIVFSLTRMHSCRGFHEPIAFLVSTLTIWTYTRLKSGPNQQGQGTRQSHVTIRLDRIWSDEAVEAWVQSQPDNTRGYLEGVGNINDSHSGQRLLQAASLSLSMMPAWRGLATGFARFIESLRVNSNQSPSNT